MTLKEMRAQLESAKATAKQITENVQTEKRSMTDAEIKNFDDAMANVETLKRSIKAVETMQPNIETKVIKDDEASTHFRAYLKGEKRASSSAPANSNNTNADGKYLNPNAFSNDLFAEVTDDNGVLSLLRPMKVSSDKLEYPTVDDTATGAGTDIKQAKELDTIKRRKLAIANVEITLNTYAVETVISNQLRDDNAVNLEATIAGLASAGIARNASKDVFIALGAGITIKDSAQSGVIGYDDYVSLVGSVNGKYYARGEFLMSQASFINILGMQDANKRPLVTMPIEKGMKPTMFGKPITIDDNAGTNIFFGDFSTVVLAQNQNTTTLVDIYSLSSDLATKYVTSARMGAGLLSSVAVAGIKPKA